MMLNENTTTVQDVKTDVASRGGAFALTSLLDLLDEGDPIRSQTFIYHLYQSDTTVRGGLWDASANEACSALDALTDAMVRDVLDAANDKTKQATISFRSRRRLLTDRGVIDPSDNELLSATYIVGRCRARLGDGIDAAWANAVRGLIHTAATHLLARYAEWRKRKGAPPLPGVGD